MANGNGSKKSVSMDLYKAGVIGDLSFGVWGASTQLKEDDLGLKGVPEDLMSLGRKRLVDRDRLKKISSVFSQARSFFRNNSFEFPFGDARFIPYARLQRIADKMEESEKKFYEEVDALVGDYDSIRSQMMKKYDSAFDSLLEQRAGMTGEQQKENKKILLAQLKDKYPSKEDLKSRFKFEFVVFDVQSPEFNKVSAAEAIGKHEQVLELEKAFQEKVARKLDGFLDDVVGRLKTMVLDSVKKIQDHLENDTIKMSTVGSFKKFAETFRSMDFVDMNIDAALKSLEAKLESVTKSDLDDKAFQETLAQELDKVKAAANSVDVSKVLGKFKRMIRVAEEEK